jgi:hypothetical protein
MLSQILWFILSCLLLANAYLYDKQKPIAQTLFSINFCVMIVIVFILLFALIF